MRLRVCVCNDSMVNIFERLPPKSIIRFRSLSKYWHSRLVSPEFLRDHRIRCSKNPKKVLIRHLSTQNCDYEYKEIYTLHPGGQLPLDSGPGYVSIPGVEFPYLRTQISSLVGSCNGILCLLSDEISLWNFSIRRRLIVPRHPSFKLYEAALGFGFDPIAEDYKIVVISCHRDEYSTCICSMKTDSWSAIPSPTIPFRHVISRMACYFNGILHWVVEGYLTTQPTTREPSCFILTFNVSSHEFGHILLPEPWTPWTIRHVTTIKGRLAVVSWEGSDSQIWVMKEYGKTESWYARYLPGIQGPYDLIALFQPVTNGNILAYYRGSKVCNIQTGRFTKLMQFGRCFSDVGMYTYVESLELIDKESAIRCGKTIVSSN